MYGALEGSNPRLPDCNADAPTTAPLRRFPCQLRTSDKQAQGEMRLGTHRPYQVNDLSLFLYGQMADTDGGWEILISRQSTQDISGVTSQDLKALLLSSVSK